MDLCLLVHLHGLFEDRLNLSFELLAGTSAALFTHAFEDPLRALPEFLLNIHDLALCDLKATAIASVLHGILEQRLAEKLCSEFALSLRADRASILALVGKQLALVL